MAYDPKADPDAAFFRSRTPRAARIAACAATQAHPQLDPRPQAAALCSPYGALDERVGGAFAQMRYGASPAGKLHVSRMLAYLDIVVGWGGTGLIPNPAMVDAAHRHGALCLGTIFQPDKRIYDSSTVPATEVAAKFVSLARYFGFDGYFFNFEGGDAHSHAQVLDLIAAMRRRARADGGGAFHVQFYDGSTNMEQLLPVRGATAGSQAATSAADSAMLDQGWSAFGGPGCCSGRPQRPEDVYAYCQAQGFDPFATAFFGFQLYPGPGYLGAAAPEVITPNGGGPAYGALQLYSADDGLRTMLRVIRARARGPLSHSTPETAQAERARLYSLERMLFSGASENPALDNRPDPQQAQAYAFTVKGRHLYTDYKGGELLPSDQAGLPMTYGVANFITERSPVGAAPFVSRFNTGEGDRFFIAGEPVCDTPWFNMGVQDVLPTWQWRREPFAGGLDPAAPPPRLLDVDYDFETAFDGGSSLRVSGALGREGAMRLWLYKTELRMQGGDALHFVFKGAPAAGARVSVGLVFEDAPQSPVWRPFAGEGSAAAAPVALASGWSRAAIDLAPYGGRTLAAILLGFTLENGRRDPVQIAFNLGEIHLGPRAPSPTPAAPKGLKVQAGALAADGRSAQARLAWDYAEGMAYYDVFARAPGRSSARVWLGRIDGDRYYAANAPLNGGRELVFEVTGVRRDAPLSPSPPARVRWAPERASADPMSRS